MTTTVTKKIPLRATDKQFQDLLAHYGYTGDHCEVNGNVAKITKTKAFATRTIEGEPKTERQRKRAERIAKRLSKLTESEAKAPRYYDFTLLAFGVFDARLLCTKEDAVTHYIEVSYDITPVIESGSIRYLPIGFDSKIGSGIAFGEWVEIKDIGEGKFRVVAYEVSYTTDREGVAKIA